MAELRCLVCNNVNPENAESCQFCGARLRQPTVPLGPIKVGDAPTPKSTSDLEGTLPGWLRDIRSENAAEGTTDSAAMKPSSELLAGNRKPPSGPLASKKPSSGPLGSKAKAPSPSDFLAGLSGAASDDEDEVPDWLASIKAPEPPPAPAPSAPAAQPPAAAPADWMSGLRAEIEPEKSQQSEKIDFGFSASDTWLDETPQKPAPAEETSEDVADWLRTLDQGPGKAPAQPAAPQAPAPTSFETTDSGVPDWLSGLEQTSAVPSATAAMPPAEQPVAASDWFTPNPAAEPAAPSDSAPDWLASLEAPSTPAASTAAQPASDLPDWFADINKPAEAAPAAPAESAPDWLSNLGAPTPPIQSAPPAPTGNLPSWLADINQSAAEEPAQPAATSASDMPDWISGFGAPATPAPQPPAAAPASDVPDWMSSLGEPATPASQQPAAPASDRPDGMSALGAPATPTPQQPAVPATDVPDWMASLGEPATPAPAQLAVSDESIPDWMRGAAPVLPPAKESEAELPTFEAPAWLADEPAAPAAAASAFPASEMPSWMVGFTGAEASTAETATPAQSQPEPEGALRSKSSAFILDESVEAGEAEALLSMDMPDWLSGMAPAEVAATPSPAATVTDSLTSATASEGELPSWVQAMRPVESMVDTGGPAEESYVEDQGPLAGLPNVLPGMPGLLAVQKPRAYANRLELTDNQQAQSNLLEALIAAEATPKAVTSQKRLGSARVLRWVLAALVLLAVIVPVMLNALGTQTVPTIGSSLSYGQTSALFNVVNGLQANDPVLLVFAYEPGLAGELEAAALPVIEHAKLRGAHLIAISTSPTGPLLAEHVFDKFRTDPQFRLGTQYTNLGYLAGGMTGMASFAAAPQQAAPLDNAGAWSSPVLANVKTYRDFAAVIIITDSAETGRTWIEQTAAYLNGKPMLVIASAQAEPMLWPYYNSQQIKGMVSGLSGGAYYDVLFGSGKVKLSRAYWDAFGYSLTLAFLALVIGGVVSLVMYFRARAAEEDEA